MSGLHRNVVDALTRAAMADYRAAVERACEAALQSGDSGVLIEWGEDGMSWSVSVSMHVPYGRIYEIKPWLTGGER